MTVRSAFGLAETEDEWVALLDEIAEHGRSREPDAWASVLTSEARTAQATRRWSWGPDRRPQPVQRVPGDVLGMRATACTELLDDRIRPLRHHATLPRAVMASSSFWVPARMPIGFARPQEVAMAGDVRLGDPEVTVWWSAPALCPPTGTVAGIAGAWAPTSAGDVEVGHNRLWPAVKVGRFLGVESAEMPVSLNGVTVLARRDGTLRDACIWVLSLPSGQVNGAPTWCLAPGRPSWSAWGGIPVGLGAVVAWGQWSPPEAVDHTRLRRPDLRKLTKGRNAREQEESGRLAGVRVLRAPTQRPPIDSDPRPTRGEGGAMHARPIAHHRRGHWRRARVGPEDAWAYEWRWIEGAIVNGTWVDDDRTTVWRLPRPSART